MKMQIQQHFDKLLVVAMIIFMSALMSFFMYAHYSETAISWVQQNITGMVGLFAGLVTGQALRERKAETSSEKTADGGTKTQLKVESE